MNTTWKYILSLLTGIPLFAAGDLIKDDKFGANDTDRDYVKYLKDMVASGEMSEDEARSLLNKKYRGYNDTTSDEFYDSVGGEGTPGSFVGNGDGSSFGMIGQYLQSLIAYYTRGALTGAEREQNEFNAAEAQKSRDFTMYMAQNKYQMETQSMQNAGLNPAMVYGGGNLVPTASNGATGQGSNIGGLDPFATIMALVRMPLEMKKLNAEVEDIYAARDLKRQQRETEEAETRIRNINAEYADLINGQTLQNMQADYNNTVADTDFKTANKDFVITQKDAQVIANKYLDERYRNEVDNLKKQGTNLDADTAKKNAEKAYQNWYNNFCQTNGFLPSSNDALLVATYIGSLFGIAKDDVKNWMDNLFQNLPDWMKPNRPKPGQNTPPETQGASVGGGSR